MPLARQQGLVHRIGVASPLAFANWQTPTVAELNSNAALSPNGQVFNLTCALNTDGTTFDLGDATTDDSLTFCQTAGSSTILNYNPEIVFEAERSTTPWIVSNDATRNTANLAFSLLAWRGVEFFAWMSVGKAPEAPFAVGDRIKLARVVTDQGIDVMGSGENIRLQQNFANRGDVLWNYKLTA